MWTRDWQPIDFFMERFFIQTNFTVSARDLGILRDKMHVISGMLIV